MHMSFWCGTDLGDVLFPGLSVSTTLGVCTLCAVLVAAVWVQQGVKLLLLRFKAWPRSAPCQDHTGLVSPARPQPRWRRLGWECSLYLSDVVLSYGLMLLVMSYNVWVVGAVVLGSGASYSVLGHRIAALSRRPLIPCAHCLLASRRHTSTGEVGTSTPVVSQTDLQELDGGEREAAPPAVS